VWCYAVSFTLDGIESVKDSITVSLLPQAPSNIAVTSKQ